MTEPARKLATVPQILRGPGTSPKCGECPFGKEGKPSLPVRGEGPAEPLLIVIGEGPGENERHVGRPFVGASGKMVHDVLERLGTERPQLWISNALLCTPRGATDSQKEKARECCAPRLKEELAAFPGRPILALGSVAARTLIGSDFSISKLAGSYHEIDGRGIIPTIHPAAILRGGAEGEAHRPDLLYWLLLYDFSKAIRLGQGKLEPFTEDVEWELEDPNRAHELISGVARDARCLKLLACDLETDSLSAYKATLDLIGVGTVEGAVSVRWDILQPRTRRLLAALLRDSTITKSFQNGSFDRPICRRYGMPVSGPIEDTMTAHQNAFPGLPHDLQRIATQIFPIRPWKAEYRSSGDKPEDKARYNALDTLATVRLTKPLLSMVKHTKSERTYQADMEAMAYHERMHIVGIPLDRKRNAELEEKFSADVALARVGIESKAAAPEIHDKLFDRLAMEQAKRPRGASGKQFTKTGKPSASYRPADPPGFLDRHRIRLQELHDAYAADCPECEGLGEITTGRHAALGERRKPENVPRVGVCSECRGSGRGWTFLINSPEHVAAYLKARGVPMFKETEKGKVATDREVLDSLLHLPEVRGLVDYREAEKMLSTFVVKYRLAADARNRMHSRWGFAITGRWTAEDPQVMNVPRGDQRKKRPNMRTQIVAPPGRIIVGFDASQLEARMHALVSGDEFLCEIFSHPPVKYTAGDIHSVCARLVWHDYDDIEPKRRSELRDFIKRTIYGACYQAAVETLHKNLLKDDPGVRIEDVGLVVNLIQRQLKGVIRWHQELLKQVQNPPHEIREPILGRRLVFPLGYGSPSDIFNFPIQAGGASYMAVGLRKMDPLNLPRGAEMILQVHDACYFECDVGQADEIEKRIVDSFDVVLENAGIKVPFPVEVHRGQSWGDI